jgi:O-acetyl-ADP-ribose deacetylase (regulator of RNase III)
MNIALVLGDITIQRVDAIVNAANNGLWGGGGVDGAIHEAAGERLDDACSEIRRGRGGCPTGEAVLTPGFDLPARYIIHTVGPVWYGGTQGEPELLASCYTRSLALAEEHALRTIAFPAISTGVYGYPPEAACEIAWEAVLGHAAANVREVRFVLFSGAALRIYEQAARKRGIPLS